MVSVTMLQNIFRRFFGGHYKKVETNFPNKSVYQIGETFGSREPIGSYVSTGQLDGQFDFNLYLILERFLQDNTSFKQLHNSLMETFPYYGNHSLMGNITESKYIIPVYFLC